MVAACIGLFDDRGNIAASGSPAEDSTDPSAASTAKDPRCRDSTTPDLTTSTSTGCTPGRLLPSTIMGGECLLVRAVVQRVSEASVSVAGQVVSELPAPGLLVLVGVTHDDTAQIATALASKIYHLRILDGEKSCADTGAPLLVVSQFTLYGQTTKGRRPTWQAAAPREIAEPVVTAFADALRSLGGTVGTGVFGADMAVALVNDGPVTLILEA
jgi:D-tyrosyl-tRNA(Tyr) deacylase